MKHDHYPVIVHRSGGVPASLLNACGECGCFIVPSMVNPSEWVELSEAQAALVRAGQVAPQTPERGKACGMKFCTNCLGAMKSVLLLDLQEAWACVTEDCVRRGLVTVFGYDQQAYPVTEEKQE